MEAERERFEAWAVKPDAVRWNGTSYDVREGWEGSYRIERFLGQWQGWQARARLSPPADGSAAAGVRTYDRDGMFVGESPAGAALAWAQWCDARSNTMLRDFLRHIAPMLPASVPAQQPTAAGDAAPVSEKERRDAELLAAARQGAEALADVLAAFQHAEPEALKAAIQHANRTAHAAYARLHAALTREAGEQEGASNG